MEKFDSLGVQLPTNDEHITTETSDVILSEGNLLSSIMRQIPGILPSLARCRICQDQTAHGFIESNRKQR